MADRLLKLGAVVLLVSLVLVLTGLTFPGQGIITALALLCFQIGLTVKIVRAVGRGVRNMKGT